MMRWGSIIFSLPAILLLSLYGWELSTVNDCIDQGLSYSFELSTCIEGKQDVSSPFYARYTFLVNGMLLLSVVGSIMMTAAMIQRGMVRNQ